MLHLTRRSRRAAALSLLAACAAASSAPAADSPAKHPNMPRSGVVQSTFVHESPLVREMAAPQPRPAGVTGLHINTQRLARLHQAPASGLLLTGLPLDAERSVDLALSRISAFSSDAVITVMADGPRGLVEQRIAPPTVDLFTGTVSGDASSRAFLWFHDGRVQGYIVHEGRTHIIAGHDAAGRTDTVIYDPAQVDPALLPSTAWTCHAEELAGYHGQAAQPAGADDGGISGFGGFAACRVARIAVDTDHEFTLLFGNNPVSAAAYAAALFGAATEIYSRDVNVRLEMNYLRLWTTPADPWDQGNTIDQLFQFRDHWNANMTGISRTLAHYLSGRGLGGGVAYLEALCVPEFDYGLSANLAGAFPYPLQNNNGANWDMMVFAHELGHNFGSPHTHDYVPQIDNCAGGDCTNANLGTIMSYCHQCPGGMSNIVLEFGPVVSDHIIDFMNGINGTCTLTQPATPPAVAIDALNILQDTSVTIDVLANDIPLNCLDINLDSFEVVSAAGGSITLSAGTGPDGRDELTYTPPLGFGGVDSFAYTIINEVSQTAPALVQVNVIAFRAADNPSQSRPGVDADHYALGDPLLLPDFPALVPYLEEGLTHLDLPSTDGPFAGSGLADNVGSVFTGWVNVPTQGVYTFYTDSDDGSRLLIGNEIVVDNDGLHGMVERSGQIALLPGKHRIRVEFFERGGGAGLIVRYAGPSISKQVIPPAAWFRAVAADVNRDGVVGIADLLAVIGAWGPCPGGQTCPADVNGDTVTGIADLLAVIGAWG